MKKTYLLAVLSLAACGGQPAVIVQPPPPIQPPVACTEEWVHMPVVVNFPTGGADLDAQNRNILQEVVRTAITRPDIHRVRVEGHTDNCGSESSNLALSQARATSVAGDLQTMGVPTERIETIGYGTTQPRATPGCTHGHEIGDSDNRRVEFTLLVCR